MCQYQVLCLEATFAPRIEIKFSDGHIIKLILTKEDFTVYRSLLEKEIIIYNKIIRKKKLKRIIQ